MTALITGGSGLLGKALLPKLQDAVVLSRDPAKTTRVLGAGRAVRWDPAAEPAPLEAQGMSTLVRDVVDYSAPLGPVGEVAHVVFVRRTLDRSRAGQPARAKPP